MRAFKKPMSFSLKTAGTMIALANIFVYSAACEPRIEEPLPPIGADKTQISNASQQEQPKKRCIKATPEKAARKAPEQIPDPACPPDDLATPPKLKTATVVFTGANGKRITVELADSEDMRARGLMFRKQMPEDHGMLFLFNERVNHTFWMHNTCIPLDMLFIDDDGTIVGIEENTPTMNDSSFQVGCPSRNVLEVNAGFTRKYGIKAGQKIETFGL